MRGVRFFVGGAALGYVGGAVYGFVVATAALYELYTELDRILACAPTILGSQVKK